MDELTAWQAVWISGLREMADFLESRPMLISPLSVSCYAATTTEDFADCLAALGSGSKVEFGGFIGVERRFGSHKVCVVIGREEVCERVVIGTETVEEPDPEAVAALPKVPVEREIVEWRCPDSFLRHAGA